MPTMVYPGACTDIIIPFVRYTSFDTLVCFDGLPGNNYWPPGCVGHGLYGTPSRFMKTLRNGASIIGKHDVTTSSPDIITFTFTSGRKIIYFINTEVPLPSDSRIWDHIKHAEALYISGYEPSDDDRSFYHHFLKLRKIYMAQPWGACHRLVHPGVERVFWDGQMGNDGTDAEKVLLASIGDEYVVEGCHEGCENCHPVDQAERTQRYLDYMSYLEEQSRD